MTRAWETVIGLETHVQLRTASKMFCGCSSTFGAPPNTNVCPVCLGLPGALPAPNELAVQLAVRAALALGCAVLACGVLKRADGYGLLAAVGVAVLAAYLSWPFLLVVAAMIALAAGLGIAWSAVRLAPDGSSPDDD